MVLKLIGYAGSYSLMVAAVLHEKKVPFELITPDMAAGEHKKPEFLEKYNPFGQVPCMDDDGFILWESRAIAKYICDKYPDQGPALVPKKTDIKATAKYEQAILMEIFNFHNHIYDAAIKKEFVSPPDIEGSNKELEKLEGKLAAYDKILASQKYIAGNELTLADLFHLVLGNILQTRLGSSLLESKPNVARWWKDISSRPSWVAVKDGFKSVSKY